MSSGLSKLFEMRYTNPHYDYTHPILHKRLSENMTVKM